MTDDFNQRIRDALDTRDRKEVIRLVAQNPHGIDRHTLWLMEASTRKKPGRPRNREDIYAQLECGMKIYEHWQSERCSKTRAIENYANDHSAGTKYVRRDLDTFCGAVERIIAAVGAYEKITGKRPFEIEELWGTHPEALWIWTGDPAGCIIWPQDYDLIVRWSPLLDHLLPDEENWDWDYGLPPLHQPEDCYWLVEWNDYIANGPRR